MDAVQRPILQGEYKLTRVIEVTADSILYFGYALAAPERYFAIREFKVDLPSDRPEQLAVVSSYFQPIAMHYMDFVHPGATCLRDFFFENGYVYFVFDFVPGHRLSEVVGFRHGRPFTEMQAVNIALQIADTMSYMHTMPYPIYLADMNLSNIIIANNGAVMLTDYGLGKLLIKYQPEGVRLGTAGYSAPEQKGPSGIVSAYTDMYSLGVLMHQLVTSVDPTENPGHLAPIVKYNPAISQDYISIVETATNKDPRKRFISINEMIYSLRSIAPQRGKSIKTVEHSLLGDLWRVLTAPFTNRED